ncbi:hypothetical protein MAM1_0184c07471 [Mucor ambiguus]|uniref:C2H2-type domain-containing protein n=1 Tax=Mucor ambiguus TaxID=91626 RepID=A0A0C9MBI6_9FUNG|nr:hypothetical protein MAM1_0184c07471 [Mucor ambiguus]
MNSRYRERKYNTSDNDRLIRALSQPVQAWEKKWTPQSNSKTLQTFKWVKSDKVIEFEQDEESEEEPEPMETDQTPLATTTVVEQVETVKTEGITNEKTSGAAASETTVVKDIADGQEKVATATITATEQPSNTLTDANATAAATTITTTTTTTTTTATTSNATDEKKLDESSIPGGPSSIISNKAVSSIVTEDAEDDDDQRSQTPKLDDISDDEEKNRNDDDEDNDVDSINDASKHPALAPHAQAHMTDDDMTDSTVATPQTTTEGNTPMPMLEDEPMEESTANSTLPHPLSQEILTGATAFINNEDNGSMNNDSPAIQTPEDHVPQHQPEAMEEHGEKVHKYKGSKPDIDDPNNHCRACQRTYMSKRSYHTHLLDFHQIVVGRVVATDFNDSPGPPGPNWYCCICKSYSKGQSRCKQHCIITHRTKLALLVRMNTNANSEMHKYAPDNYCAKRDQKLKTRISLEAF